jgi:D-alanine-D-alanine ligase
MSIFRTRVGVIYGGPNDKSDVSHRTGAAVASALDAEKYEIIPIRIARNGTWFIDDVPVLPHEAIRKTDVLWNALHGYYGGDGKLQNFLEAHSMPFTGSDSLSSAIGANALLSKDHFRKAGIKVPMHVVVENLGKASENAAVSGKSGNTAASAIEANRLEKVFREVHSKFAPPYVVKPVSNGSLNGVSIAKNRQDLADILKAAMQAEGGEIAAHVGDPMLVEEFIHGIEASVGVVEGYRGQEKYALPAVETRDGAHTVPSNLPPTTKAELERLALAAHSALGLSDYSRSDFIVTPRRGIFILGTDSQPELSEDARLRQALAAVGTSLPEFVQHVLTLALD